MQLNEHSQEQPHLVRQLRGRERQVKDQKVEAATKLFGKVGDSGRVELRSRVRSTLGLKRLVEYGKAGSTNAMQHFRQRHALLPRVRSIKGRYVGL
jgi:hypothetical protein